MKNVSRLLVGLIIGLLIGTATTYVVAAGNDPGTPAFTATELPDDLPVAPQHISVSAAQSLMNSYGRVLGGLDGWYMDRSMLDDLLLPVNRDGSGADSVVTGLQCYLGKKQNSEYTLIFGSVVILGSDTVFMRDNLYDFIDPCPKFCPDKGGL